MKNKKINKKITYKYIQSAAYRYLERYATTEANLKYILQRKVDRILKANLQLATRSHEIDEWIEDVVKKSVELGLVDDLLYASAKLSTYGASGNSIAIIKNKLRVKGVPENLISEIIENEREENPEFNFISAIKYAKRRRFGPFRIRDAELKTADKEKAAMARAGYSYNEVEKVLKGNREELEEILYGN
jgi:regulatory protein